MTNSKETGANPIRISRGEYRCGSFYVFERDDGRWQMGEPIDWNDPVGGGFRQGSTVVLSRLRDCKERARRLADMGRPHMERT